MNAWDKKQEWHKRGNNFLIVIRHHTRPSIPEYFIDEGENMWNVYAYIYPRHSIFKEFSGTDMFQESAINLPFHGGPSFLKFHYDDNGQKTSIQIGSDYSHLYDERFSHYKDLREAHEVIRDAESLFHYLEIHNSDEE